MTLTSGATIGDLLSKTGYTYQSSSSSGDFEGVHYSQNKLLVNGVMLNGVVHPESYISDTSYVLRDGDVVQFIHMDWPSFEFNYIYRDAPNWIALGNKLKVMALWRHVGPDGKDRRGDHRDGGGHLRPPVDL